MFKISIGISCMILALVLGNAMVVSGQNDEEAMSVPMGVIPLEPPDTVEDPRPSVAFNHPLHFDYSCQTCHHKWEKTTPIVGCETSGCHDVYESPKTAEKGQVDKDLAARYYKTAYHKMCINCHKELKAQNEQLEKSGRVLAENLPNPGPTSCKGCHVPEE